jgi:hypothetical protein
MADTIRDIIDESVPKESGAQPEVDYGDGPPVRDRTGKLIGKRAAAPQSDEATEEAVAARTGGTKLDPTVAQVMGQMQRELDRLKLDLAQTRTAGPGAAQDAIDSGPGGYPWQYYRRREDGGLMSGWIVTAPGGAAPGGRRDAGSFALYSAKGHRPLMNYGVAPVPSDVHRPGGEYATFIQNGGAREFPAAQVVALKWHINPPIAGTVFPEYEKVKDQVKEFHCEECDFEIYFLPEDKAVPRACFGHLRQSHQYNRTEATLVLRAQGITDIATSALDAATMAAGGVIASKPEGVFALAKEPTEVVE